MENLDVMVLRTLRDWRQSQEDALLVTVVHTWGSSPRPVGSIMAMSSRGAVVGSVSGGCIEDDLLERYARADGVPHGRTELIRYGVSADEAHRFGLPCGGTVELLLEYNPDLRILNALLEQLEAGQLVQRRTRLSDGLVTLQRGTANDVLSISTDELRNTFGPTYRMLLIGAGQISECMATMALFCGFDVTVCDPREEYCGAWSVPGVRVRREMPDDVVLTFKPDRRSCVVALTHDPKLDDLALLEALNSDAFYVGAIGSRRNSLARRERMVAHFGHSESSLARLRGPIGIYVASKTPPEIAVSVMAEILALKNGLTLPATQTVAYAKKAGVDVGISSTLIRSSLFP
jgi:xanthine dehydrogenase accessory factor